MYLYIFVRNTLGMQSLWPCM